MWQAVFGLVRYFGGWAIVAMLTERYLTTKKSQLVKDYCTTFYAKVTTAWVILTNIANTEIVAELLQFPFLIICLLFALRQCVWAEARCFWVRAAFMPFSIMPLSFDASSMGEIPRNFSIKLVQVLLVTKVAGLHFLARSICFQSFVGNSEWNTICL